MSTPNQREILISWLIDAYSMERSIVEVLREHSSDAKDFPEVQAKIQEHLKFTESQSERVKQCLEKLGGDVSGLKADASKSMGVMSALPTKFAEDKLIRNAIAEFATENFEMASYNAIATAARELDEEDVADTCEEIIDEELEMAEWLDENIPALTELLLGDEIDEEAEAILEDESE